MKNSIIKNIFKFINHCGHNRFVSSREKIGNGREIAFVRYSFCCESVFVDGDRRYVAVNLVIEGEEGKGAVLPRGLQREPDTRSRTARS